MPHDHDLDVVSVLALELVDELDLALDLFLEARLLRRFEPLHHAFPLSFQAVSQMPYCIDLCRFLDLVR